MRKLLSILICIIIMLTSVSCNKKSSDGVFEDQNDLYGVCYIAWEEVVGHGGNLDEEKIANLIKNLGAKSVRVWMRANDFMTSSTQMIDNNVIRMKNILKTLTDNEIAVIGMNGRSFNHYSNGSSYAPLTSDEHFEEYISEYSTTWYNLVSAFPEIEYWEIGNEPNNKREYYYLENNKYQLALMSFEQMAEVFTQELYYASQSIHLANPEAKTILGGITESAGLGLGEYSNAQFLQEVYNNIYSENSLSKNPDDYFECVAWHPYTWTFDEDYFVEKNNEIYRVILDNENKGKKVFLTEFGWSENKKSQEEVATYIERFYKTVESKMPYVESACIFRLFNDVAERSWIGDNEQSAYHMATFGLFADPVIYDRWQDYHIDLNTEEKIILKKGAPKPAAYAFQKMAGGKGALDLLTDR